MADEKVSQELVPDAKVAHDTQEHEHELAQGTERRKSVALNIVENPLKVRDLRPSVFVAS